MSGDECRAPRTILEFADYYRHEGADQALGNGLFDPQDEIGLLPGSISYRECLGGLLRYCHHKAG